MSDKLIFWKTGGWRHERIERVEVEKVTESSVYIKGARRNRFSRYESYHTTWQAAKDHLLAIANKRVNAARCALEAANAELENIKGLKDPT